MFGAKTVGGAQLRERGTGCAIWHQKVVGERVPTCLGIVSLITRYTTTTPLCSMYYTYWLGIAPSPFPLQCCKCHVKLELHSFIIKRTDVVSVLKMLYLRYILGILA
jgi:hypothetical protein